MNDWKNFFIQVEVKMLARLFKSAFNVSFLLLLLTACSASTPATSVPHPSVAATVQSSPTATAPLAGTVLFQADWSHGVAGWQGTHGFQVVQGQLEANSGSLSTLILPYQPTVTNYALEMRIQVVRLLQQNGGYFTIFATKAAGKDGYLAGVNGLEGSGPRPNGSHPQAQVFIDPFSSMALGSAMPIDYEPGFQPRTYRVEVQDNQARLLVDGVQIGRASSEQTETLSNGPLGLNTEQLVLHVSSVRILAL